LAEGVDDIDFNPAVEDDDNQQDEPDEPQEGQEEKAAETEVESDNEEEHVPTPPRKTRSGRTIKPNKRFHGKEWVNYQGTQKIRQVP
jgi:hypothetical protein